MHSRTTIALALAALSLLAASCGSDSSSGSDDDDSADIVDAYGVFQVSLVAPQGTTPGFTSVLGRLQDGPTPSTVVWEEAAASGNCRLLTPRIPFCDPSCGSSSVCVDDVQCEPYPTAVAAGAVRVEGLHTQDGDTAFSMEPIAGSYQPPGGASLAYPPCPEGNAITFTAAGTASVPGFSVTAVGIAPLEVLNETVELAGEPVLLRWTPPGAAGESTISVSFDVSYHGGSKGKVVCECSDAGALEVPASLLDQLQALGTAGFPKVEIARRTSGTTDPPAQVDLVIESMVTRFLDIPGLVSCNEDGDCPQGQVCGGDFTCQ